MRSTLLKHPRQTTSGAQRPSGFRGFVAPLSILSAALLLGASSARASTAYGSIHNFDVVNDTGQVCHGFEIEFEDIHSSDITHTYNYNHYGVPEISEDNSDPSHPRVRVRYRSAKNADGTWTAYTAVPSGPIAPTNGHMFTNPALNFGGEHFGVGFRGAPTAIRYHWLVSDAGGNIMLGPEVLVSTPTFNYAPAVQQVQAIIRPAPPAAPPVKEFGKATWVKEIRTTTHNPEPVKLRDLISDDPDDPDDRNWRNNEPDEVEVEWQLLQTEFSKVNGGANGELQAGAEDLPGGDEVVTRRYEFFAYTGPLNPESGEAFADNVGPDDVHGVGSKTIKGVVYDLSTIEVVGKYLGAQMSAFDPDGEVDLTEHLQAGERNMPYPDRTIVIAGSTPFTAVRTGDLPPGLTFDEVSGLLSGTPTADGEFQFTIEASDARTPKVTRTYTLAIAAIGAEVAPHYLVDTSVAPGEGGTTTGDGSYEPGTDATVVATPAPGFQFKHWSEQGEVVSLNSSYTFSMDINHSLVANFEASGPGLPAPAGLTATDGSSTAKVSVTWVAVPGAVTYHVFRNTANDSATAAEIGVTAATNFDDTTGEPATAYHYWVKAEDASSTLSEFGGPDAGHRQLAPPANLTATVDRADHVALMWTGATGATEYEVSRNSINDPSTSTPLGTVAGSAFDDTSATPDTDFYYWVRSTAPVSGPSAFSTTALGRRLPAGGGPGGGPLPIGYSSANQLGSYSGLIRSPGDVISGTAGFRLSHNRQSGTGNLSGALVIDGARVSLRGAVLADGTFSGALSGVGAAGLVAALQIHETADGSLLLLGTVTDTTTGVIHKIDAGHHSHSKVNPTLHAGQFTLLIPAEDPPQNGNPDGDGCGIAVVKSTGAFAARIVLGDGTRTTLAAMIGDDGRCGIYRNLYKTTPTGHFAGEISFQDLPGVSDFDGNLSWVKQPTLGDALFPAGFELEVEAIGSRYQVSAPGVRLLSDLADVPDNLLVRLEGGGVAQTLTATWLSSNVIQYNPKGLESLGVKISSNSGFITGVWRERRGGLRVPFSAVIFQKQNLAGGGFRIESGTGIVRFEAP
jgi:hypothetical protein